MDNTRENRDAVGGWLQCEPEASAAQLQAEFPGMSRDLYTWARRFQKLVRKSKRRRMIGLIPQAARLEQMQEDAIRDGVCSDG